MADLGELVPWLTGGGITILGSGLAWAVQQIRVVKADAAAAETKATESAWNRLKEVIEADRQRITDLEAAYRQVVSERDVANHTCNQQIEAVRADLTAKMLKEIGMLQAEYDRLNTKYRDILRICADQEEEIQHSRIVIAKINERRGVAKVVPPTPAPLLGLGAERRGPTTPAAPGTTTVTVTVPAGHHPVSVETPSGPASATHVPSSPSSSTDPLPSPTLRFP